MSIEASLRTLLTARQRLSDLKMEVRGRHELFRQRHKQLHVEHQRFMRHVDKELRTLHKILGATSKTHATAPADPPPVDQQQNGNGGAEASVDAASQG